MSGIEYQVSGIEYRVAGIEYRVSSINSREFQVCIFLSGAYGLLGPMFSVELRAVLILVMTRAARCCEVLCVLALVTELARNRRTPHVAGAPLLLAATAAAATAAPAGYM